MRRAFLLLALVGSAAAAQLPGLSRRSSAPPTPAPALMGIDGLRAEFAAQSGSDKVYFGGDSAVLTAPARATLAAQAQWLRRHPEIVVRIEGHADSSDTRDHALAVAARRAEEVRDYLVLLGVPVTQLSTVSWGKERIAVMGASQDALALNRRAVTVLVR
jgi:peptidoglycan-associated lipoprotein